MFQFPLATVSLIDENNYLIKLNKVTPTKGRIVELFDQIEVISNTKYNHFLIDLSEMVPVDRQNRVLIDFHIARLSNRIAFFASNEMGIMMARLYEKLLKSRCTFRVFSEKEEAIAWLKTA